MIDGFKRDLANIDLSRVFITHTGCPQDVHWLKGELIRAGNPEEIEINIAGAVISSHTGPRRRRHHLSAQITYSREGTMTRFILIAISLVLIVSACTGLSSQQVSESEIATKVALLKLTPGASQPTPGEGVVLATIQTANPELTATVTTTPTPTVQVSDPIAWLGAPTWRDTFSGSNNFYTTTDENVQFNYANDAFNMTAFNNQGWHSWSLGNRRIANFYLEATIKVGDCSSNDQYGLVFRAPDTSQGYFYVIRCGGNVRA